MSSVYVLIVYGNTYKNVNYRFSSICQCKNCRGIMGERDHGACAHQAPTTKNPSVALHVGTVVGSVVRCLSVLDIGFENRLRNGLF